jgi:alpha-mannosidase
MSSTREKRKIEKKKYEIHLIPRTHWNREWLFPFQKRRMMLVNMLDSLLEIMDRDPKFKYFHTDAQTVLLEDYLEIRPENELRLKKYIKEGRILIGPWYSLPDENLVNGECIVRNLMFGYKLGKKYGKVMKVGETPCSYGQVSQMPQIYSSGFGIDSMVFHRGVQPQQAPKQEFIWEGPDGTRVFTLRPLRARTAFAMFVSKNVLTTIGPCFYDPVPKKELEKNFYYHFADKGSDRDSQYLADELNVGKIFRKDKIIPAMEKLKKVIASDASTNHLIAGDGHDYSFPHPLLSKLVDEANKLFKEDHLFFSTWPAYLREVRKKAKNLTVLTGEMRNFNKKGGHRIYQDLFPIRIKYKQQNRKIEFKLLKWVEPWTTLLWLEGEEYPEKYLHNVWKNILVNQAHDSLPGVAIDEVYKDVGHRYFECQVILDELLRRSLGKICLNVDTSKVEKGSWPVLVFNPLPFFRNEIVSLSIDFPQEDKVESFSLKDLSGEIIPYQLASKEKLSCTIYSTHSPIQNLPVDRYNVYFPIDALPPLGYKTFQIKPGEKNKIGGKSLVSGSREMENEFLKVKINENGTLKITHKETGKVFDQLNYFQDEGEVGVEDVHLSPQVDEVIDSLNSKALIARMEEGRFFASFKLIVEMKLPQEAVLIKEKEYRRSKKKVKYPITSTITLRKGIPYVEILTEIDNTVKDHRLKVLFPTNIKGDFTYAEAPFDVVKRAISLPPDAKDWQEEPQGFHPQHTFVDITDGDIGLAIINEGLPEYQAVDNQEKTIALSLLRCFNFPERASKRIIGTESQSLEKHTFHYAIYPHKGNWEEGKLFQQAYRFNLPPKAVQTVRWKGDYPLEKNFLRVEPSELILSCFKRSETGNSAILRLFNPTPRDVEGRFTFFKKIKSARIINLNEEPQEELKSVLGDTIEVKISRKQIVTLELFF